MAKIKSQKTLDKKPTPEIDIFIEDSVVDPGSGQKYTDLIIQSDDIALLEKQVNLIEIGVSGKETDERRQEAFVKAASSPEKMLDLLGSKDNRVKDRRAGYVDPKESVSHGDISKINSRIKIEKKEVIHTLIYDTRPYQPLPRVDSAKLIRNARAGIELSKKIGPEVVSRKEMESGILSRDSVAKFRPRIRERKRDEFTKKSVKKIRVTSAPHEAIEVKLRDKDNRLIRKIDTGERNQPLRDKEEVKYVHPKSTGFFRGINESEALKIGVLPMPGRRECQLNVQTLAHGLTGFALYQREITEYPILDEFDLIKKINVRGISKYMPILQLPSANPVVFRAVPIVDDVEMPTFVEAICPGEIITSEGAIICYYQKDQEIIINFHRIPFDTKKIEIWRTNENTGTHSLVTRRTVTKLPIAKKAMLSPILTISDGIGKLNATLFYEIRIIDALGISHSVKNFCVRSYNKSPNEPRIISENLEESVTSTGGFVHTITGEIGFLRPWVPQIDESLEDPSDSMRKSAMNGLRICKIEVERFDHFGNKENLGIFTLNPGQRISELESEITQQKTVKYKLVIDQAFTESRNLNPTRQDLYYYYIVRPIDYALTNEMSLLRFPEKIVHQPKNNKTGYSYDPIVFDSPLTRETGINPSIFSTGRNDLHTYGSHACASVLTSYVPRSSQEPVAIKGFPQIFISDNRIDVRKGAEERKQEKELYCHLVIEIPVYYLDMVDHFELWAATSSLGKPELLTRFLATSERVEYIDFETPGLATNTIQYTVRGLDYQMKEAVTSRPLEIKLEKVLNVKDKTR